MSYLKLADTLVLPFSTCNSSGALTNADALPVVVVRDNGADMGYAPVVTNISAGRYEVTIVASSGNGFTVGHHYSVWVYTNMNTVSIGDGIGYFNVKATDSDDLVTTGSTVPANVTQWNGHAVPAENVNGVPKVDVVDWLGTAPAAPTVAGIPKVEDATLQSRLTATRAGYLDNLSAGAVALASDVATLLTRLSAARAGYLDNLSAGAVSLASDMATMLARLTSLRAGYLDNLSAGAVALHADAVSLAASIASVQADTDDLQIRAARIQGLLHENAMVDGGAGQTAPSYSANGVLLLARVRIFADATALAAAVLGAADGANGEVYRYTVTGQDTGTGLMKSFKIARGL